MWLSPLRVVWFLPLFLAPALSVHGETAPLSRTLFDETFAAKSGAWVSLTAQATNGELVLACPGGGHYEGGQVVFTPTLKTPPAGEGQLRLQFTVAGVASSNGGYSARFFLAPGPVDPWHWVEPYAMPHVLAVYIDGDAQAAILTVYAKSGTETGCGRTLYSAGITAKSFPLTMTLLLDRAAYRVQFSDGVETRTGSRSGKHGLDEARWSGDVATGLKLVNLTTGNKPAIRLARATASIELAPVAAPTASAIAATAASRPLDAVVQVHPQVARSVGGYDQVQALFGGNANGLSRGKADALIRELKLNTCRLHMWPAVFSCPPDKVMPLTPSFASQMGAWMNQKVLAPGEVGPAWDKWFQQDFTSFLNPAISNGAAHADGGSQESQLAMQKAWNADENIVFMVDPKFDSNALRHIDDIGRYFDQYLGAVEKYAPWIHPAFAQLSNEPNYGWWTGSFAKDQDPVAGWIALYNGLDAHLRQTHPATRLLGPCLASSTFFSWGEWQTWTVPVLKGVTRDLEDFNYHNYDTAAQSHLAWVQMLQAQAEALGRKRPRAVVTEMNDSAACDKAGRKFEWWAEQFFMAFDNPDKFHLWSYFFLAYAEAAGNVVSLKGGAWEPTDAYWLFWALRQTRGTMRYVEPVGNPEFKVFACAPQDDRLVVSLFNDTGRPAKLTLRSGLPKSAKIQSLLRWSAHRQADIVWHAEDTLAPAADVEATVPPGAVQSYVWTLAGPTLNARQTVAQREFVSKTVDQKFSESIQAPIDVPRLPNKDETVAMRFAVASDDLLAARCLTVEVGGDAQSVAWTEAPREEERGQRSTWWMELPVPRGRIARSNPIAFTQADAAYRLMFASLVYRQHPTAQAAREAEAAALNQRRAGLAVSFPPLGALLAGAEKPIVLTVENRQDQPATCAVSLAVPAGLTVAGIPASTTLDVPAKGRQEIRGTIRADNVAKIQNLRLVANVESKDGDVHAYPATVTLYPKRTAVHFTKPLVIDGKLDDWPAPDVSTAAGSAAVQFRAGWDAENLYLAADVKTGKRPGPPANVDHFWEGDVMEVFLDLQNTKSPIYEDGDGQFYFCPYSISQGGTLRSGYCQRVRKGDLVAFGETLLAGPWQTASQVRDDGYVLECKIPWSVLTKNFAPHAGIQIGMDVLIHGCESIFGAENKPFECPRQWGILTLE